MAAKANDGVGHGKLQRARANWACGCPAQAVFATPCRCRTLLVWLQDLAIPHVQQQLSCLVPTYPRANGLRVPFPCAGKYSVPVLWDKKEKTIVNNEVG